MREVLIFFNRLKYFDKYLFGIWSVSFSGFLTGDKLKAEVHKLDVQLLVSTSENFGMVVPEALINRVPVIAAYGTPWEELNDCDAGWWKDNAPETIAGVMKDVLSKSDEDLLVMGKNGRQLIEEKYEQHKVAGMMMRLYEWIVNGGEKPNFVVI